MASTKKSREESKKKEKETKQQQQLTKSKEKLSSKSPTKKTPTKSKQETKKSKKITNGKPRSKREASTVPSSSFDSQEIEEIGEENENGSEIKSGKSRIKKNDKRKEKTKDDNGDEDDGMMCRFPMARIKRIIKSEDPDLPLSRDVVFLVNRATEKFLEQFCDEAYQCSVQDRKKSLGYNHLASVVSKRRRFDFLSDFVPEKITAKDALAQRKLAETG